VKKLNSRVVFRNKELFNTYKKLEDGNSEEQKLYKWITRAIQDLKEDAFSGLSIPKDRIPKKYQKEFEAKSVWKYDLPKAFRLIYTIENNKIEVFAIILEWFDHKSYEKRFNYSK
jgi:mRNA-degrading endonuclease RelE of RelBE toxin-antitoxin system